MAVRALSRHELKQLAILYRAGAVSVPTAVTMAIAAPRHVMGLNPASLTALVGLNLVARMTRPCPAHGARTHHFRREYFLTSEGVLQLYANDVLRAEEAYA